MLWLRGLVCWAVFGSGCSAHGPVETASAVAASPVSASPPPSMVNSAAHEMLQPQRFQSGGSETELMIYPPSSPRMGAPAALLLPGGNGAAEVGRAWHSYHLYAQQLAERGIVAGVVSHARGDRTLVDERRREELGIALDRIRSTPGVDPQRLFLLGFSMGGVNSLLLAAARQDIAGVVTFFTPVDWRAGDMRAPPGIVKQPVEYLSDLKCPVLVLQGEDDTITPSSQAKVLKAALDAQKLPSKVVLFPGQGHGFTFAGAPRGRCCNYDLESTRKSLDLVVDFIQRGL